MTTIAEIVQLGSKVLRLKAVVVTDIESSEIKQLIDTLQDTWLQLKESVLLPLKLMNQNKSS